MKKIDLRKNKKNETIFLVAQIALDFISSDNIKSTKLKSYLIAELLARIMKLEFLAPTNVL